LDKLQAGGQRATFFLNGDNYDNIYYHNATVRRIITDGHQIGSHT
jgi:peptidoglycan/xylan/chitin deacetylase (PgdA/CDA1 family)